VTQRAIKHIALWISAVIVAAGCGSGASNTTTDPGAGGSRDTYQRNPYQVVISEINYHDVSGDDAEDFLELHNTGQSDIALTGWCISGIDFCFTEMTMIASGAFVVVEARQFAGKLSNKGETLQLRDAIDNIADEVTFSSESPWPKSADGRGDSLHRVVGGVAADDAAAWVADVPSPGVAYDATRRTTASSTARVVINEINYHPSDDNPADEFIELLNVSAESVSLAGWCMPDLQFCFDSVQTNAIQTLAPGAVTVVTGVQVGAQLSNKSATVRLLDAEGIRQDVVRYEDNGAWPALADGHGYSLQRRDPLLIGYEPGNWEAVVPTPGVNDQVAQSGYFATFESVTHTQHPVPGQEIVVSAKMRDGESAVLQYKINFDDEVSVPMAAAIDEAFLTATIPAQSAGTLVRYRIVGVSTAGEGTWPRQGDGMTYHGTVVQSPAESQLPRLQWFVQDNKYQKIYTDRDLYGDNGYPTVIAYNGQVFDDAMIRIRGNQSRLNQKRKWKIVLPAGYEFDMGGLLETPVNEFALNSAVTDKSFVREILTSELQSLGGGIGQQVFPLRFEKNNEFYGLYLYQEQPDGHWREKHGFSKDTIAFKADLRATLNRDQLDLSDREMKLRYQRKSQRYVDNVDEIRQLIRQVTNENREQLVAFAFKHLDIPQIIEAIATMRVAQHLEWEHKNHLLLYDPADEKWRLVPIDFDLNFGRRFVTGCNAFCEEVEASGYMEYMESNRLARIFLKVPEFREMLDRRTKTLADVFLAEGKVEQRIGELEQLLRDDAARDRKIWYTYGEQQSMQRGQEILINQYFVPKRKLFTGPASSRLPGPQNATIKYVMTGDKVVTITSSDSVAIDISGLDVVSLSAKVPSGTVLLPGQSVVLSPERTPRPALQPNDLHVWVAVQK